jgi:hypothetical protein
LKVPDEWVENTTDDDYNAQSHLVFNRGESVEVRVIVLHKSANAPADALAQIIDETKASASQAFTKPKFTDLASVLPQAKGFILEGKMGDEDAKYTVYVIEKGGTIAIFSIGGSVAELEKYAAELAQIRASFVLRDVP